MLYYYLSCLIVLTTTITQMGECKMFDSNILWMLMIIPGAVTLVLLSMPKTRRKLLLWEVILIMVSSIICIVISQNVLDHYNMSDKELWGFNPVKAVFDEPFRYWDTCTREVPCGTDSKGNTQYCTETDRKSVV